jgi:hypothetical protein
MAAGAAGFAEWLRGSEHARAALEEIRRSVEAVQAALPLDRDIQELVELMREAEHLPMAP